MKRSMILRRRAREGASDVAIGAFCAFRKLNFILPSALPLAYAHVCIPYYIILLGSLTKISSMDALPPRTESKKRANEPST